MIEPEDDGFLPGDLAKTDAFYRMRAERLLASSPQTIKAREIRRAQLLAEGKPIPKARRRRDAGSDGP